MDYFSRNDATVAAAAIVMIRRGDEKQEIRLSHIAQRTGK
jgi:hypothetical protein